MVKRGRACRWCWWVFFFMWKQRCLSVKLKVKFNWTAKISSFCAFDSWNLLKVYVKKVVEIVWDLTVSKINLSVFWNRNCLETKFEQFWPLSSNKVWKICKCIKQVLNNLTNLNLGKLSFKTINLVKMFTKYQATSLSNPPQLKKVT